MQYRRLGNSDLQVSALALGSWLTYGVTVDADQAKSCLKRAFDAGINFVDTANMYGKGTTECRLGELLSAYRRNSYLLATKVYYPMTETDKGLSRRQIEKQIDASLARLRTDHVDLYQCHAYDEETPLEETMHALSDVVRAGKARYIGFCNWKPRQVRAAAKIEGVEPFVSSQPQYSLLRRKPERKLFAVCAKRGIGQIVWSPLAQGVLTGKYLPGHRPPQDSRAGDKRTRRKIRRFTDDKTLDAVQSLRSIAANRSLSLPQLALAWVLRQQHVASAIIGASRPEQIEENVGAVGATLDDATCEAIDRALHDVVRY